jgi:hypothetical protein
MGAMKLSEALRLGAMLRPQQAYGALFNDSNGGTCALGAIADAVGLLDTENNKYYGPIPEPIRSLWRPVANVVCASACPQCGERAFGSDRVIVHLNNEHKWSRERIADWIESIERAQEQCVVPEGPQVGERGDVHVGVTTV